MKLNAVLECWGGAKRGQNLLGVQCLLLCSPPSPDVMCVGLSVCLQVCFWLMENGLRVLIAGCDTFRAGAVEQLRTHAKHLNSLHPPQDGAPAKVENSY